MPSFKHQYVVTPVEFRSSLVASQRCHHSFLTQMWQLPAPRKKMPLLRQTFATGSSLSLAPYCSVDGMTILSSENRKESKEWACREVFTRDASLEANIDSQVAPRRDREVRPRSPLCGYLVAQCRPMQRSCRFLAAPDSIPIFSADIARLQQRHVELSRMEAGGTYAYCTFRLGLMPRSLLVGSGSDGKAKRFLGEFARETSL
jgi:hypothetical protein